MRFAALALLVTLGSALPAQGLKTLQAKVPGTWLLVDDHYSADRLDSIRTILREDGTWVRENVEWVNTTDGKKRYASSTPGRWKLVPPMNGFSDVRLCSNSEKTQGEDFCNRVEVYRDSTGAEWLQLGSMRIRRLK